MANIFSSSAFLYMSDGVMSVEKIKTGRKKKKVEMCLLRLRYVNGSQDPPGSEQKPKTTHFQNKGWKSA